MSRLTKALKCTKFSPPDPSELQNLIENHLDLLIHLADELSIYPRQAEEYLILATKLSLLLKQLDTISNAHVTRSYLAEKFEAKFRQKNLQLLKAFTEDQQTPLEWSAAQLLTKPGGEQHLGLVEKYFRSFSTKLAFQKLLVDLGKIYTEHRTVRNIVENDPKLTSFRIMVELADLNTLDQQIAKVEAVFHELSTLGVGVLLSAVSCKMRAVFPHQSTLMLNALLYRLDQLDGPLALLLTKIADDAALTAQFYELLADEGVYDNFERFISAVLKRYRLTRVYIEAIQKWCIPNDPAQPKNLFAVVAFESILRLVYLFVRPLSPVRHKFRRNVCNEQKLRDLYVEIQLLFQNFD